MEKCNKTAALYLATLKAIDTTYKKIMGVFGKDCLNCDLQVQFFNLALLKYKNFEDSPVEMSLAIEKDFLTFSQFAYNCFEQEDRLTLGLDDMIFAISGKRESVAYLLQQP